MQETSHLEICHENASLGYYSVINCIRKESCKKGNCIVAMFILHFLDCHNFSYIEYPDLLIHIVTVANKVK